MAQRQKDSKPLTTEHLGVQQMGLLWFQIRVLPVNLSMRMVEHTIGQPLDKKRWCAFMIVNNEKIFEQNSSFPNSNWLGDGYFIIDETTEDGQIMTQVFKDNYPFVAFEHDGQLVTKVIMLDKPEEPISSESQEAQLVRNELGLWEYILVDKPVAEIDLLKKQIANQQAILDLLFAN